MTYVSPRTGTRSVVRIPVDAFAATQAIWDAALRRTRRKVNPEPLVHVWDTAGFFKNSPAGRILGAPANVRRYSLGYIQTRAHLPGFLHGFVFGDVSFTADCVIITDARRFAAYVLEGAPTSSERGPSAQQLDSYFKTLCDSRRKTRHSNLVLAG